MVVTKGFGIKEYLLTKRGYKDIARAVASEMLVNYCGLNQRAVAEILGLGNGSAVCHKLKFLRERKNKEKKLVKKIERVEAAVERRE